MAQMTKIAAANEVPPGKSVGYELDGQLIALFNVEGTYYAVENRCPHADAPMVGGYVDGTTVSCPFHGADFDLKTGAVLCPPARENLRTYKVVQQGEDILVEL